MSYIDAAMVSTHFVFGAIWVGAVAFVTLAVLPLGRDGEMDRLPLTKLLSRLLTIARLSAVFVLLSGLHLMGSRALFDLDALTGTNRGVAVLAMIALWFGLIVVLEIGIRRIKSGLDANLLREPSRDGLRWLTIATLFGVGVFVLGGLMAGGIF